MPPTAPQRLTSPRRGTSLAVASMLCVQLGLAASVKSFGLLTPAGSAWMRLLFAGALIVLLVRPKVRRLSGRTLGTCVGLGVATAGLTLLFVQATARIPLGTASAIEFLGPLGVAVLRAQARIALVWAGLAACGVVLLTEPWHGSVDALGVTLALGAAACWALYILLTQLVGDAVTGLTGLAVSLPVAAVVATVVVGPGTWPVLTWDTVALGLGLAVLLPLVPFSLEMMSLRHLSASAFGTLMSLEPAIALAVGLVVLQQVPGGWSVAGLVLVVLAGVGAERTGHREPPAAPLPQ